MDPRFCLEKKPAVAVVAVDGLQCQCRLIYHDVRSKFRITYTFTLQRYLRVVFNIAVV